MKAKRLYHSIRLLLCRSYKKRAAYLTKHDILGAMGDNCLWGPWLLPIYPKLIKVHDNVKVHKTALLVPHDVLNRHLKQCFPKMEFGHYEKIGCIELMDNAYISMNSIVMPDVRVGKNSIVSAMSVVTSDVPDNTIVSGNPAKPVGKTDMFAALRQMSKGRTVVFRNQFLPDELAEAEWDKFNVKRAKNNQ